MPPLLLTAGSEIKINPPLGQKCILDIDYTTNPGAKFKVKAGKQFINTGSLTMR